jgi:transposase
LKIGKASLYLWRKQRRETGSVEPKKNWRKGHSQDLKWFRQFVKENEGLTTKQMAEEWGNITQKTICKWLNRIGFTRKKDIWL